MVFQMLIDASIREMTVPEEMPQWFDPSFEPTPGWTLPPAKLVDPEAGERFRQEIAALGFRARRMADTTKSRWKRYSDEQLREMYPPKREDWFE